MGRVLTQSAPDTACRWARRVALLAAAALFAMPEAASAQSFWNWGAADYDQRQIKPKRNKVKRKDPAETAAKNAAKPVGPLVIAVSVEKQRVKVYDSNGLFAESPVSTGTKTHPTPYGVFSVIQKNRHHVSNLYGAAMPYMQRITWSGVAMHTGVLPGYAASHGCIRLPNEFAARLWTWTKMGTRVIVAPGEVTPSNFSHTKLVTKMAPLSTVSAAPAPSLAVLAASVAQSQADRNAMAQQRTADAREVIEGMRGTLSDVTPSPRQASAEAKPAEPPAELKHVGIDMAGDTPVTLPGDALPAATAEAKPAEAQEKSAPAGDSEIVKAQDRHNSDDSEQTTATVEDTTARPAAEQAAEAPPTGVKPADATLEIAKPADIIKPADGAAPAPAKPADVAVPAATPEPAKPPVVASTPRRHNHVAVFISRKDKKLYIRHGYEPIYDTAIEIADADKPLGTHVFTARGDANDASALHWSVVSLPQVPRKADARLATKQGKRTAAPVPSPVIVPLNASEALDRITIPAEAMEKIASIITPGGSLLISDHGLTGWETGKGTDFIVPLR